MTQKNHKRIVEALQVLEEEGRKSFDETAEPQPYECIGMAIAAETNSARDILHVAYAALEDWNYHDLCAVIEWAYPLYGQTFHKSDIPRLERMIDKQGVNIQTDWNPTETGYDTKPYNVRVIFQEATPEQEAAERVREAAPELLESLKALFEHCVMIHSQWGENSNSKQADEAIKNARAAIHKATGAQETQPATEEK